jgi:hypothetical protein
LKANKLDYEEQEERQTKFKAKALEGILPRIFKSPDDLKFQAGHSVEQHFKQAEIRELKASLDNPRVAPQKEPWINLPNTHKQILARDGEARKFLDALGLDASLDYGTATCRSTVRKRLLSQADPVEQFLARLYTDLALRDRFLAAPQAEAARNGLSAAQSSALEAIDRVGLKMAAHSFAHKRSRRTR